ncbi:unnamed protein product [Ranitomeya imitator]|uniref:G-protein coupled receptors family 3 profile domain-containing protein n=1 Tax=Ranitomeya imitator TaxID=111125 RepID=A0ABN9MVR2_9NEOB|nr:unnamed protein product [Ranitomeya imitator]
MEPENPSLQESLQPALTPLPPHQYRSYRLTNTGATASPTTELPPHQHRSYRLTNTGATASPTPELPPHQHPSCCNPQPTVSFPIILLWTYSFCAFYVLSSLSVWINSVKLGALGSRFTLHTFSQIPSSVCSDQCLPGHRKIPIQAKPVCCYDCIPCSMGEVANNTVVYDLTDVNASECLKCPLDQWSSEEKDRCIPKVVEFLTYEEPLGIMLVIMVVIFSSFTVSILILFAKHQETPIIKATNRELSYILLVSLISLLPLLLGQPTQVTCLLRQTFFSMVFCISISSVLAKTIMVILAFKATRLTSPVRKWLGPIIPRHVVGLCSGLQIVICSVWVYKSPPFPALNSQIENHKIIFECNEGHKIFFYMTLGFMGLLAMISFFVAFLAKNLPGTYNEAKLITFSMLVFCCVWISFIPAYLSTSGKYTVAVQVFAILASSAGLLSCIFLPKCYILLLRPERNSRELLVSNKKNGMFG